MDEEKLVRCSSWDKTDGTLIRPVKLPRARYFTCRLWSRRQSDTGRVETRCFPFEKHVTEKDELLKVEAITSFRAGDFIPVVSGPAVLQNPKQISFPSSTTTKSFFFNLSPINLFLTN
jgi:hypothetical protein